MSVNEMSVKVNLPPVLPCGGWRHVLTLDPAARVVGLLSLHGVQTPAKSWRLTTFELAELPDGAETADLVLYLEGAGARDLLTIVSGWSSHWDGREHVGIVSAAAAMALDDLRWQLERLVKLLPRRAA